MLFAPLLLIVAIARISHGDLSRLCKKGDLQLGGLFSLHYAVSSSENGITDLHCEKTYEDSVVLVEAMIYAITMINADTKILKHEQYGKLWLGYDIQGTCDDSPEDMFYALDVYTDLEMDLVAKENPSEKWSTSILQSLEECDQVNSPPLAALIGPPSTAGSTSVSSLFRLYDIPVISYDASSPELGDHDRFPSFYRTIYGDDKQAEALVDLVDHFDWNYVAVVGSDDTVGKQGIYQFKETLMLAKGKCVSKEAYFSADATDSEVEEIVDSLKAIEREEGGNVTANVTLLFMPWEPAVKFLKIADRRGLNGSTWLGVDNWTSNISMILNTSQHLEGIYSSGTIATQMPHQIPQQFLSYLSGFITPRLDANPWLFDYFCEQCSISFNQSSHSSNCTQIVLGEDQRCLDTINIATLISKQKRITNVITAVYSAAYALDHMLQNGTLAPENDTNDYWVDYPSMLDALSKLKVDKIEVLCEDDTEPVISFDENGNLKGAHFEVHNFLADPSNPRGPAKDRTIGLWDEGNGESEENTLTINDSVIYWKTGKIPSSSCSDECQPGYRVIYGPTNCCWKCELCPESQFSNRSQLSECYDCPEHFHTTDNQSNCEANALTYILPYESLGIINTVLCVIGELAVLLSTILTIWHRKHPMFSDKYTLKTAYLINCALGYTYVVYHTIPPDILLCSFRRVMWQTTITAHCIGGFFSISLGRQLSRKCFRWLRIPREATPLIGYLTLTLTWGLFYLVMVFVYPPHIALTDLGPVTGETNKTYSDCGDTNIGWLMGFSIVIPASFWVVTLCSTFRSNRRRKQSQILHTSRLERDDATRKERDRRSRIDHLHVIAILYASYVVILILGALTPIYVTMDDPWSRNFLLLMGGFTINSALLGFFILPRAKNVLCDQYLGISRSDSMGGVFIISGREMHRVGRH